MIARLSIAASGLLVLCASRSKAVAAYAVAAHAVAAHAVTAHAVTAHAVTARAIAARAIAAHAPMLARGSHADGAQTDAATPRSSAHEETRDARLARWRELLELDLAREFLSEALRLTAPDGALAEDGEARALCARALAATGDSERAESLLARSPLDARTLADVELARARLALDRDLLAEALSILLAPPAQSHDQPEPRRSDRSEAWILAARALARAGDLERAAPYAERFVALAPHDSEAPAAWHVLAQAAVARRDLERARAYRERAEESGTWQAYYRTRRLQARANPDDPLPRLGIAQLWLAADEPERARALLVEIVARWPGACRAHDVLGEAERKLGKRDEAYAAYARALECDPALPEAHFNRGMLAFVDGKTADARTDLEWIARSSVEADPRFLLAHLFLARALRANGAEAKEIEARYARYVALGGREAL